MSKRLEFYLHGIPLAVFLWFLRGGGSGGVDWRAAYTYAGSAAAVLLLWSAWRRRADWLLTGTNLWLASGALCFLARWWWPMSVYTRLGPGSPFLWSGAVALAAAAWAASRRTGGARGPLAFSLASACACVLAVNFPGGSSELAGTVPFVALLVVQGRIQS